MSDDPVPSGTSILGSSDEQAKAIQELAKLGDHLLGTAEKSGHFLSKTFGTLPENLVGILGDRVSPLSATFRRAPRAT